MTPTLRRPEVLRALAWVCFCLTLALLAAQTYYVVASRTPMVMPSGLNSFPIVTVASALGAAIGVLVVSRHPRNVVGWLFCFGMLGTALGLLTDSYVYAVQVYDFGGTGWLLEPAMVVSVSFGAMWAITLLSVTFLVFPDGRLSSRRWRPVALLLPVPILSTTAVLVWLATTIELDVTDTSPDLPDAAGISLSLSWLLLVILLAATATSLVRRLRRSAGVLRQQLRWLSFSAVMLVFGMVVVLAGQGAGETAQAVLTVPLYTAFAAVPVAAGVAVLRLRLYDIDVVINRAVVLTGLLLFVAVGYVVAVVTLGALLGERTDARFWPSLLALVVVALAFQPLRRRVERLAARLAYGPRAVPYEALADLTRRLETSAAPQGMLTAVAEAAAVALGAQAATVRLLVPGGDPVMATWPPDAEPAVGTASVDVHERGELLGSLTVLERPGQALRTQDLELLTDLADQSSLALRNARLTADLSARVAELDETATALDRSRRRLIDAREAEQSRLEVAIRRDVMRHLTPLPVGIGAAAAELERALGGSGRMPDLRPLHDATEQALAQLRTLTRGVFPTQLSRSGLAPTLAADISRLAGGGSMLAEPGVADERFSPRAEAAMYFCVVETARAMTGPVQVRLARQQETLVATLRAPGGSPPLLESLHDRLDAVGGSLHCEVSEGGLHVEVRVPAEPSSTPRPAAGVRTTT